MTLPPFKTLPACWKRPYCGWRNPVSMLVEMSETPKLSWWRDRMNPKNSQRSRYKSWRNHHKVTNGQKVVCVIVTWSSCDMLLCQSQSVVASYLVVFQPENLLHLYFTCYSKYLENNECFDFNDFNECDEHGTSSQSCRGRCDVKVFINWRINVLPFRRCVSHNEACCIGIRGFRGSRWRCRCLGRVWKRVFLS